jgi:hypothetical protein
MTANLESGTSGTPSPLRHRQSYLIVCISRSPASFSLTMGALMPGWIFSAGSKLSASFQLSGGTPAAAAACSLLRVHLARPHILETQILLKPGNSYWVMRRMICPKDTPIVLLTPSPPTSTHVISCECKLFFLPIVVAPHEG